MTEDLLFQVSKPGQYLGNEWGAARRQFDSAAVRLCLAFPDTYELGMSNFGQRILYQIVNKLPSFMSDRTFAPCPDMEELLRLKKLSLWGFESRRPLDQFELIGFSLAYELTYTNVLNMLDLSQINPLAQERDEIFPLIFGGGPAAVNPEPMARFMDFFIIGDGEKAVPAAMEVVRQFKAQQGLPEQATGALSQSAPSALTAKELRLELLKELAHKVPGVYVPQLYGEVSGEQPAKPLYPDIEERVVRQAVPLTDENQPGVSIVPYLSLVHDRQVLEVRRGCDRGCRFCQPGYTFLPVRERSAEDLLRLSKEGLDNSGYREYSLLSLCVSDYTALTQAVKSLNQAHAVRRASMSFPSQRADRMNLDVADELKAVRRSGITLAPEAGTERLRAVINKGLRHEQIIGAIESAYRSGWSSVKLYFMIGLPTEHDEDLEGIVAILKEATQRCRRLRKESPSGTYHRDIEFTCTISNFVPKPFTPFQWFPQVGPSEMAQRQQFLRSKIKESGLRNVQLNCTEPVISLLESVICRGERDTAELIYRAWRKGARFDAWDDRFCGQLWQEAAAEMNICLEELATKQRAIGSRQPWDVVDVGLSQWWLVSEWKKALAVSETSPCTENTCHACGICTTLGTTHLLACPKPEAADANPFVKGLSPETASHPSLAFAPPSPESPSKTITKIVFEFKKTGDLKFISHLDLQHLLARAARRAGIAVAFSEGFNPSPKLSLALSLALYIEGLAEVGEIELAEELSGQDFQHRLNAALPAEVQILRAENIERKAPSLSRLVGRASYRAWLRQPTASDTTNTASNIKEKVSELLAREAVVVDLPPSRKSRRRSQCKGRKLQAETSACDLRPGIYSLAVVDDSPATVHLELAHGSPVHIKPSDVLGLIAEATDWRIVRVGLATQDTTPLFDYFCHTFPAGKLP